MIVHVAMAFYFVHGLSHRAALQHTAEETERVFGIHWGGGVFFNYGFLIWWGVDVVRRWQRDARGKRALAFHAVAVFMMLNATIVFGAWWWSLVAGVFLLAWVIRRRRKPPNTPVSPEFSANNG